MGIEFLEIVMLYVKYWPYFFIIPQCWKIIPVGLDIRLHLFYHSSAHAHWCINDWNVKQSTVNRWVHTPLNGEWLECPTINRQSLNEAWSRAIGNVLPSIIDCWSVHAHCAWVIWNVKPSTLLKLVLASQWLGMSNYRPSIVWVSVHAHWCMRDRECPTINCWSFECTCHSLVCDWNVWPSTISRSSAHAHWCISECLILLIIDR